MRVTIWALCLLSAVICLYSLPNLPDLIWGAAIIPAITLVFIVLRWSFVVVFGVGFVLALFHAHGVMDDRLPMEMEGMDVQVIGNIRGVPESTDNRQRFEMDVTHWSGVSDAPKRLRLSAYHMPIQVNSGEKWQLTVRLRRPHGFMNPGGFDYEQWLFMRGISAVGYVRKHEDNKRLDNYSLSLNLWRQNKSETLNTVLKDVPESGIILALTLGLRDRVSQSQWEVLRATGTSHLMAISGLHIGLVAGLIFWITSLLWKSCASCCEFVAAPRVAAMIGILAGVLYAGLAGFSVPTQRALIMLVVVMVSLMVGRTVRPWYSLSVAMCLVLLFDSLTVLSPGFWLSFFAVGVIVLSYEWLRKGGGWLQVVGIQLILSITFIPLTLWFFGQASLISPVANLIAVPLVSFITVPLSLLGVLVLGVSRDAGEWLLELAAWSLEILMTILKVLSNFTYSAISLSEPSLLHVCLAIFALLIWLFPVNLKMKIASLFLMLPLLVSRPSVPKVGDALVTFLDVGQGLSVVVQTTNHSMVFDVGAKFSPTFNAVSSVVSPYLRNKGINKLDTLVISHDDLDHSGATEELLLELPVDRILSSVAEGRFSVPTQNCLAGDKWTWDEVDFTVLHPQKDQVEKDNDMSCVIKIEGAGGSVLLTGDITTKIESLLIEQNLSALDADVLQVPHHGSKTSSSVEFIDAVTPDLAVFNTGYRNRYGFPKPTIVDRYTQAGVKTFQTDETGAISILLSPTPINDVQSDEIPITIWRMKHFRFWHG